MLSDSVKYVKGVGPKRAELLGKLGITTVKELLYHLPRRYMDFTQVQDIQTAPVNENCIIKGRVVKKLKPAIIRKNMQIYRIIITDGTDDMSVVFYNNRYIYDAIKEYEDYVFYGKVMGDLVTKEMSSPIIIKASASQKILPVYPLTEGLNQRLLQGCVKNALEKIQGESLEILPSGMPEKLGLLGENEAVRIIHFPKNIADAKIARARLAFDELLVLQLGMFELRQKNRKRVAYKLQEVELKKFYANLPFTLTNAQKRAIAEAVSDMLGETPMNRLVLGDVGSGKTAVAAALCYFTALNNRQACLMAPTEILANQHFETLTKFLQPLGVKIALLTGSVKNKKALYSGIASGEYDLVIGTHAVIQASVQFNNLSLVITDEQHRFGVNQRDALSQKGENPHKLVMSATPIPRTLALMIYGELDISLLDELPAGRQKVETYAVTGKLRERAYSFIKEQLNIGHQAYIVCPAVEESEIEDVKNVTDYAKNLKNGEFSGYEVGVLHGKLPADKKDAIMRDFKDGKIQLLVCTTVVEVGVDVPNATVMAIENSERFGLSQLHQLRGRVGRDKHKSYCILITDSPTPETKKRLGVLSRSSNGFEISEADLEIRGPGDFFGEAQHGLPKLKIADMVADTKLLEQAQATAKELYEQGFMNTKEGKNLATAVAKLFETDSKD
ncbi:MAG: ATP-dependent DNA helicase RecG [Oscillospiraceae bacterium]|nr:ATP-dependent DNA helicase RecG [Oscillospiraceae bacterium]